MDQTSEQVRADNALEAINRKLNGTATAWAQCKQLPDFHGSADTQAVLTIQTGSGDVEASFVDINVSSEGSSVVIHQNGKGGGHYAFASGDLDVRLPLHVTVKNIPVVGSVSKDVQLSLSTHHTVTIPGGKIKGSPASLPANAKGTITFVGGVSVPIIPLLLDAHIQIQIVGTLSEPDT
ncbi:MAG TPA: hypothetical protein VH593_22780 [Ktedonobacteraceae bacterium]